VKTDALAISTLLRSKAFLPEQMRESMDGGNTWEYLGQPMARKSLRPPEEWPRLARVTKDLALAPNGTVLRQFAVAWFAYAEHFERRGHVWAVNRSRLTFLKTIASGSLRTATTNST